MFQFESQNLLSSYLRCVCVCVCVIYHRIGEHSPVGGVRRVYIASRELQHLFGWANTQVWVRLHMKQLW